GNPATPNPTNCKHRKSLVIPIPSIRERNLIKIDLTTIIWDLELILDFIHAFSHSRIHAFSYADFRLRTPDFFLTFH
ncbi:MAG: hypothetical protein AB7S72_12670, partial [Draconibacterium sp.]